MNLSLADIAVLATMFSGLVSPLYVLVIKLHGKVNYISGVCDTRNCDTEEG